MYMDMYIYVLTAFYVPAASLEVYKSAGIWKISESRLIPVQA